MNFVKDTKHPQNKNKPNQNNPLLRTFSVDLVAIAGEGIEVAFLAVASRRVQILRQQLVAEHLFKCKRSC